MDEKKFDDMMEKWAADEQSSASRLRPTREMYDMLKTKRQAFWFPVMARWATVGVAAAIIVVVAILHPSLVPVPVFQGEKVSQEVVKDEVSGEARKEAKDVTQDMGSSFSASDKESEDIEKLKEEGEPAVGLPAASLPELDSRQASPEPLVAPPVSQPVPAPQEPGPQAPTEKQFSQASRSRMKDMSLRSDELTEEAQIMVGEDHIQRRLDLNEDLKKAPIDNDSVGDALLSDQQDVDQQILSENCTPLPETSLTSPSGSSVGGRSSSVLSVPPGTSRDAPESELQAESLASPKICAIPVEKKNIGEKTFQLKENIWIDTEYDDAAYAGAHAAEQNRLIIQRNSQAYDVLLKILPDMQMYAEAGEHIIVSLESIVIEISNEGKTQLTDDDVRLLESLKAAP